MKIINKGNAIGFLDDDLDYGLLQAYCNESNRISNNDLNIYQYGPKRKFYQFKIDFRPTDGTLNFEYNFTQSNPASSVRDAVIVLGNLKNAKNAFHGYIGILDANNVNMTKKYFKFVNGNLLTSTATEFNLLAGYNTMYYATFPRTVTINHKRVFTTFRYDSSTMKALMCDIETNDDSTIITVNLSIGNFPTTFEETPIEEMIIIGETQNDIKQLDESINELDESIEQMSESLNQLSGSLEGSFIAG